MLAQSAPRFRGAVQCRAVHADTEPKFADRCLTTRLPRPKTGGIYNGWRLGAGEAGLTTGQLGPIGRWKRSGRAWPRIKRRLRRAAPGLGLNLPDPIVVRERIRKRAGPHGGLALNRDREAP